jgi:L-ascorbate metabolism protein UlaG (beta-lactamase superfamily)
METTTIRLVRNATLRLQYAGKHILVDPFFAEKGSMQSAIGVYRTPRVHLTIPIREITEGLDLVLQTHIHPDHYDDTVKVHLPKDIPYYTQPQDTATVAQDGFTRVQAIEDKLEIENLTIYRIPGHHGFGKIGEMMGPVSGYVLTAKGCPTVYIMGDCKWEACIRKTVEQLKPDYIVVNSGGAVFPEFSKVDGSIIPDEEEVMQMLDELPAHIKLIAVHMDATDHGQTTRAILRNEAVHHGVDMSRLLIPEDGETFKL